MASHDTRLTTIEISRFVDFIDIAFSSDPEPDLGSTRDSSALLLGFSVSHLFRQSAANEKDVKNLHQPTIDTAEGRTSAQSDSHLLAQNVTDIRSTTAADDEELLAPIRSDDTCKNVDTRSKGDIWTGRTCTLVVFLTVVLSLPLIGFGLWAIVEKPTNWPFTMIDGKTLNEAIPLGVNALLTLITKCLGLVHTTTLRWNLLEEHRLSFNSNLRLFTSSRRNWPNRWTFNGINAICLILSFACASLLASSNNFPGPWAGDTFEPVTYLNSIAFLLLGLSMLTQALLAGWTLWKTEIPTWSSNAIVAAAICHQGSTKAGGRVTLERQDGRCMMGVDLRQQKTQPSLPLTSQVRPWRAHWEVRIVVIAVWITVVACSIWAGLLFGLIPVAAVVQNATRNKNAYWGDSWALLPSKQSWLIGITQMRGAQMTTLHGQLVHLLMFSAIQAVITLGLHAAELVVNLSRDEDNWRLSTTNKGCEVNNDPILASAKSWKSMLLFAFTPVIHWLFGLSIQFYPLWGTAMLPVQVFYMTLVVLLLAIFITYLALEKAPGPQPAAYGHLQTLVDLIDEWPTSGQKLFWGHKSIDKDTTICHAGTSSEPLPQVLFNRLYS